MCPPRDRPGAGPCAREAQHARAAGRAGGALLPARAEAQSALPVGLDADGPRVRGDEEPARRHRRAHPRRPALTLTLVVGGGGRPRSSHRDTTARVARRRRIRDCLAFAQQRAWRSARAALRARRRCSRGGPALGPEAAASRPCLLICERQPLLAASRASPRRGRAGERGRAAMCREPALHIFLRARGANLLRLAARRGPRVRSCAGQTPARACRGVPARGGPEPARLPRLVRPGPDVRAAAHALLRAALLPARHPGAHSSGAAMGSSPGKLGGGPARLPALQWRLTCWALGNAASAGCAACIALRRPRAPWPCSEGPRAGRARSCARTTRACGARWGSATRTRRSGRTRRPCAATAARTSPATARARGPMVPRPCP
jgi:hypothetical protein